MTDHVYRAKLQILISENIAGGGGGMAAVGNSSPSLYVGGREGNSADVEGGLISQRHEVMVGSQCRAGFPELKQVSFTQSIPLAPSSGGSFQNTPERNDLRTSFGLGVSL